jgi:hypothetical protein
MIFRSRSARGGAAVKERVPDRVTGEGSTLEELLEQIDALGREYRVRRDPQVGRRILQVRHLAGLRLTDGPHSGAWEYPVPAFERLPSGSELPEVAPAELTPEVLRAGILRHGFLLVRGFLDTEEALRLAGEIERAFAAREAVQAGRPAPDGYYEEFEPGPPFEDLGIHRPWIAVAGGVWGADSPRVMLDLLGLLVETGLRSVAAEYLGEPPTVSVHKCTLRKAEPDVPGAWHQDGRFMGETRSLNMWLSLSHCGDEAPGLDLIPRRIDHILPTGADGTSHENVVSPTAIAEVARETGIVRPIFEPGDLMLFDDLFLHKTGSDPEMPKPRYAVENWFFAPSSFPRDYLPLSF